MDRVCKPDGETRSVYVILAEMPLGRQKGDGEDII
jgi:hypothetical protein